jgi:hypothetical protein
MMKLHFEMSLDAALKQGIDAPILAKAEYAAVAFVE